MNQLDQIKGSLERFRWVPPSNPEQNHKDFEQNGIFDCRKNRFITITFKERFELLPPDQQFSKTSRALARWFADCCDKFTLSPELTESGRIHYHCQFLVNDKIKFNRSMYLLHRRGYIDISYSKDGQNVHQYVTKDTEHWKELIDYKYLPITKDNWHKLKLYKNFKQLLKKAEDTMLDKLLFDDEEIVRQARIIHPQAEKLEIDSDD